MDYLSLIGIAAGSLLIGAGIYVGRKNSTSIGLAEGAILFLSATGFVAGIKVILFSFNQDLLVLLKEEGIESAYIFLGGVAICWVSFLSALEIYQKKTRLSAKSRAKSNAKP